MKISIAIPTYNAQDSLAECLNAIRASTFKDLEVIVVDDCSTDNSREIASAYHVKLITNDDEKNRSAARARNMGIQEATGDIILFLDSDVIIPKDLLQNVHDILRDRPDISAVQGVYQAKPYYQDIFSRYKHYIFSFRGHKDDRSFVSYIHTACAAGRKEVFKKYKFNENLNRREDIDYGLRMSKDGHLIYVDSDIAVNHKKKFTLKSFTRYQIRTARGMISQRLILKDNSVIEELRSKENRFYKKLWLLRPVFGVLMLLALLASVFMRNSLSIFLILTLLVSSFLADLPFRRYLLRNAPLKMSVAAVFLYFYDGILTALGVMLGLVDYYKARTVR